VDERCIWHFEDLYKYSESSRQGTNVSYRGQTTQTGVKRLVQGTNNFKRGQESPNRVTNRYSPTHWARVIGVSSMHHAITMGYPLSMMHRSYQQWFELSVWVLWRLYWSLWWPYIGEYHEVLVTFMTYDHLGCVLFFGHDSSNRPIYLQIWAYISSIYICMSSAYHTHV